MQTKSLIMTVTMITVVVILAATVLIPVLDDAEDSFYESVQYSNVSGDYQTHLAPITSETSNTLNISSTNIVTNNGTIEYWADTTYGNVMLITDTIYVAVTGDGAISVRTSAGNTTATSFSAVVSAGEITYSVDGADSVSTTYVAGYVADPTGGYISCTTSDTRYFDSQNFAQCRYDSAFYAYIDGTGYKNAASASMTVASSEVADTDGQVKTLTSINYTSSKSLNSLCVMENAATYTYTDSPGVVSILGAIAPVVLAAIVLAVVGVIFSRRD